MDSNQGASSAADTEAHRRDDGPVDLHQLAKEMNVPSEALEAAVKVVGTDRNRIKDYLTGGAAGTQQDG